MNNSNIQKSLIELEESLSQINSAKSQVVSNAKSSEKLIESIKEATDAVTKLDNGLNEELDVFVAKFKGQIDDLDNEIKNFHTTSISNTKKVESNFTELSNKINNNINDFENSINAFHKRLNKATEEIDAFDLDRSLNDLKADLNTSLNNLKTDLYNDASSIEHKIEDANKKNEESLITSQNSVISKGEKQHEELLIEVREIKTSLENSIAIVKSFKESLSESIQSFKNELSMSINESSKMIIKWQKINFFTTIGAFLLLLIALIYVN